MSKFTKGPWRLGTSSGAVVSDTPERPGCDGAEVSYYGGHCVSESSKPADARLIAAAPEMFAELEKWAAIDCDEYPQPPCCQADCLTCAARALHARIVQFGPHAHAGVWISRETSDKISRDGA